jgi:hypothetical protein
VILNNIHKGSPPPHVNKQGRVYSIFYSNNFLNLTIGEGNGIVLFNIHKKSAKKVLAQEYEARKGYTYMYRWSVMGGVF